MNDNTKRDISKIIEQIEAISYELEYILDEEQNYLDGITPEDAKLVDIYEKAENVIDEIEEAIDHLGIVVLSLKKSKL